MKIERKDNTPAHVPLVWIAGNVYTNVLRKDYWLCVDARYSGGLMLVCLEDGTTWDSSSERTAPAEEVENWKEVQNIKVVVG